MHYSRLDIASVIYYNKKKQKRLDIFLTFAL
nr:MAG TPA: hypothetical protein [Caudoviricetes sp.]